MSSEVMTQENCARLQVARRVRDIAKSMIRLSMLGRSIFPMLLPLQARRPTIPRANLRLRGGGLDLRELLLPQLPPQDLAHHGLWKFFRELHLLGDLEGREPLLAEGDDLIRRRGHP